MCNYCLLLRNCVLCTGSPVPHRASVLPLCLEYSYIIAANIRKGGRELVLPAVPGYMALCENQFCIYDLYSSVPDAVHPPDPFHLIVGFQRFRNALCICHLFYQSFEHLLCLPVNICKIGIQFTAGQQISISHTVALSEIAEMPLPPYPDWPIFLRLIIPGNQIIVSNQLILQPRAFICDKSFLSYNLLFLSATIVAGELAEIECADSKKAPSRDHSQDSAFLLWIRANTSRRSRR